jgi:hypothetical protein
MTKLSLEKQVIARARELIADKKHWTREAYARDLNSHPCDPLEKSAVRFCAVGALQRAAWDLGVGPGPLDEANTVLRSLNVVCMPWLNDNKGHAAVLALFDRGLAA